METPDTAMIVSDEHIDIYFCWLENTRKSKCIIANGHIESKTKAARFRGNTIAHFMTKITIMILSVTKKNASGLRCLILGAAQYAQYHQKVITYLRKPVSAADQNVLKGYCDFLSHNSDFFLIIA